MNEIKIITNALERGLKELYTDSQRFGLEAEEIFDDLLIQKIIPLFGADYRVKLTITKDE
jgi:hypothetical protein